MKPDPNTNLASKLVPKWHAILAALVVSLIWSSTFVIVKIGLESMGPLTIAGLRYFLGFVILLPFLVIQRTPLGMIDSRLWLRLTLIGISSYTLGNGALFWGLKYIPATTGSLLMSLIPLLVLGGAALLLKEIPTAWQILGVILSLAGSVIFFSGGFQSGEPQGLIIMAVGLVGFTAFSILGRGIAREGTLDTLTLTAMPLLIGGFTTLVAALTVEGLPVFDRKSLLIVLWLALVNTAVGYWIYNHALRRLTALEMNVIMNLTPFLTALLSWIVLGETLVGIQYLGMLVIVGGVVIVQLGGSKPALSLNIPGE